MEKIKGNHFYFVGIGGVGMSGLARILLKRGYQVSGSDIDENSTKSLKELGATIYIGHKKENIKDADVVIVTAAVNEENPEVKEAREKGMPVFRRSELLSDLMLEKKGIAVAGTHGKTTTSTMLAIVLEEAGLDPAISVGGEVRNIGGNAKDGKGEYFVAEACEYDKAFLDLSPHAAIITNIEEDHLDIYEDLDDILETFKKFVSQVDKDGFLVVSGDDINIPKVIMDFPGEIVTYGINSDATFAAREIRVVDQTTHFKVFKSNQEIADFSLKIPGAHNISNALAVIAMASKLGVKIGVMRDALEHFEGAVRRFQIKGEKDGVLVIDDYGHHPTEIRATLTGLKSIYGEKRGKVWCVFQSHQYSRTKFLLNDFASSFADADSVIIPEIYRARDTEDDVKSVSGKILAQKINDFERTEKAIFIEDFPAVVDYLKENAKEGDIVITVGAGPVYKVGEEYLR